MIFAPKTKQSPLTSVFLSRKWVAWGSINSPVTQDCKLHESKDYHMLQNTHKTEAQNFSTGRGPKSQLTHSHKLTVKETPGPRRSRPQSPESWGQCASRYTPASFKFSANSLPKSKPWCWKVPCFPETHTRVNQETLITPDSDPPHRYRWGLSPFPLFPPHPLTAESTGKKLDYLFTMLICCETQIDHRRPNLRLQCEKPRNRLNHTKGPQKDLGIGSSRPLKKKVKLVMKIEDWAGSLRSQMPDPCSHPVQTGLPLPPARD